MLARHEAENLLHESGIQHICFADNKERTFDEIVDMMMEDSELLKFIKEMKDRKDRA